MLETSFQSAITISAELLRCSQKIYGAASGMGPVFNYRISTPVAGAGLDRPLARPIWGHCSWTEFELRIGIRKPNLKLKQVQINFPLFHEQLNWQYASQLMGQKGSAQNAWGEHSTTAWTGRTGKSYTCCQSANAGRKKDQLGVCATQLELDASF